MSIGLLIMESFGWTNSTSDFNTRYNITNAAYSISPTGGRFGGGGITTTSIIDVPMPSGPSRMASGFALYISSPSINNRAIMIIGGASGGGGHWYLCTDGSGRLQARFQDGTVLATGTTPIVANAWHWVEFDTVINTPNNGSINVWLDDVQQIGFTGTTQSGGSPAINSLEWGNLVGGGQFQFSDWYVKNTIGKLGQCRVLLLIPSSDGAETQWTPSTPGPHFSLVNNIPPGGDTNYVEDTVANDVDCYGFTQLPYTPNVINALQTSFFARTTDATTREISPLLRIGGTDETGTLQSMLTSFVDYIQIFETNPKTTNPWSAADVNSSQYGTFLVE